MKRTLFLMTHKTSFSDDCKNVILKHPNIDVFLTNKNYNHYDDVIELTSLPHKTNNALSVWCDILFYNSQFTSRELIKHCKFVYLELPADIDPYYKWRLSGMKDHHKKTGGPWVKNLSDLYLSLGSIF